MTWRRWLRLQSQSLSRIRTVITVNFSLNSMVAKASPLPAMSLITITVADNDCYWRHNILCLQDVAQVLAIPDRTTKDGLECFDAGMAHASEAAEIGFYFEEGGCLAIVLIPEGNLKVRASATSGFKRSDPFLQYLSKLVLATALHAKFIHRADLIRLNVAFGGQCRDIRITGYKQKAGAWGVA